MKNIYANAHTHARHVRDHAHTPLTLERDRSGHIYALRGEDEIAHRVPGCAWDWYESMQYATWVECPLNNRLIKRLRDSFGGVLPTLWGKGVTATLSRYGDELTVIYSYQEQYDDSFGGSVCWPEYTSYVSIKGGEFHDPTFEVEDEDFDELDWSDIDD